MKSAGSQKHTCAVCWCQKRYFYRSILTEQNINLIYLTIFKLHFYRVQLYISVRKLQLCSCWPCIKPIRPKDYITRKQTVCHGIDWAYRAYCHQEEPYFPTQHSFFLYIVVYRMATLHQDRLRPEARSLRVSSAAYVDSSSAGLTKSAQQTPAPYPIRWVNQHHLVEMCRHLYLVLGALLFTSN